MSNKKHLDRDLFVMDFVQFVSAPQTHPKRMRKIKKTMELCPDNLTQTQWMKMWRGFYYAIWYSEMRKGGEELIEEMGNYQNDGYLLSGFKSLTESWGGIDSFRIDKYMLLQRILLRNVLKQKIRALNEGKILFADNTFLNEFKKSLHIKPKKLAHRENGCCSQDGEEKNCTNTKTNEDSNTSGEILTENNATAMDFIVFETSKSVGLFLHVCDIYLDELEKALNELAEDNPNKVDVYFQMLAPFGKRLSSVEDERIRKAIRVNIFDKFIDQVIVTEPIATRVEILNRLLNPLVEIASHTELGKNRNCLYSIADKVRSKTTSLKCPTKDRVKLKRRIIGVDRKAKKLKYEVGTSTPFVRSLVPLPLI